MTDMDKIMANLASPEAEEALRIERRTRLVSACASGLFATAADITAMNREAGVEDGPAILLEGAALFVAQLFEGVHRGMGKTSQQSKQLLDVAVRGALRDVRQATAHGKGTVQ